ncbi:MAG: PAS domain S-box protein [Chloroflexi bacterium]|nr:PAS domain S-box protein [Chloroflexota bacterium]
MPELSNPLAGTLRARIFTTFVIIGLLAVIAITLFTTIADFRTEEEEAYLNLRANAKLKAAQIEYWVSDLHTDLSMLFSEKNMLDAAQTVSTQPVESQERQIAYEHLGHDFRHLLLEGTELFDQVLLINLEGKVVLSTGPIQEGTLFSDQDFFREGLNRGYSGTQLNPRLSAHDSVVVAQPILDLEGRPICVIVGWANSTRLTKIMLERSGVGDTGKTYLVNRDYTLLTEPDPTLAVTQDYSQFRVNKNSIDLALATKADGFQSYQDYRGVPVLSTYRWIPDLNAVLLAEQDQSEAFDHVYIKFRIILAITGIVMFITLLVARQLIRDITAPLSDLAHTAIQIREGNLDIVAPVERQDEIGAVAQAFNTMTTRLRDLIQQLQKQVSDLELAEQRNRHLASFPRLNPNPVIEVDSTGQVVFFNPATQAVLENLGMTVEEIRFFLPSDLDDLLKTSREKMDAPFQRVIQIKDKVFSEAINVIPQFNVVRLYAFDITEREQAAEQLRKLSRAVEQSPATVIITDPTGCIEYVNPHFCQTTGYMLEEVLGKNPRILKSGFTPREQYQQLWQSMRAGKEWQGEFQNRKKNGELYWESAQISPIFDEHGKVTHLVGVKIDITERKRAEQALQDARDELEMRVRERTTELENAVRRLREEIAERKRAQEIVWQHATRSETLTRIAGNFNAQLGLEAVLNAVCEETGRALNVPVTSLHLQNPVSAKLELVATFGSPPGFKEHLRARSHVLDQVHNGQSDSIVAVPDMQTAADPLDAELYAKFGIRTGMSAQLTYESKPIGILKVFITNANQDFPENELALVRGIMRQAAQAITNARLYEAEASARRVAETLTIANLALTQSLNLDIVLETLLDSIVRLIPYDSANVMLLDGEFTLSVRALRGYERWNAPELVRSLKFDARTNPILRTLLETHHSIRLSDTEKIPDWKRVPGTEHVRSWLGVPLVAGGHVVGLYSLDKTTPDFFTETHQQVVEALAAQAAVAIQNAWLFEQLRADRERLESLSRRLVEVQETERRYVARELHDEAGQLLTGLKFGLRVLERETGSSQASEAHIAGLHRMVDDVLDNLHRLAMHLRPATLDQLGLVAALREYVEEIQNKNQLIVEFETVGLDSNERLAPTVETTLYRIVQEALTNILRHAQASRVQIILEQSPDRLLLTIDDDGVGFDYQQAIHSGRLGLLGMKERVDMLTGILRVDSTPGEGTTLIVEVPHGDSHIDS